MEKLALVKLREAGQSFFFSYQEEEKVSESNPAESVRTRIKIGDYCIVEADRGSDYGHVISCGQNITDKIQEEPTRKIIRIASADDLKQIDENKIKAKEAFNNCQNKIREHKQNMKLVNCEYSFDRGKIIFYFTAESRIDFRELVKDLAKILKARIELRQIGVRDEARLSGGMGACGRQLCCVSFLKDFEPVMIKMAKEQGLPLNPPKISGLCGRLMCCLSYEYATYTELSKGLPREGEHVHIEAEVGKVVSVNKLKRCCMVQFDDGRQIKKEYK